MTRHHRHGGGRFRHVSAPRRYYGWTSPVIYMPQVQAPAAPQPMGLSGATAAVALVVVMGIALVFATKK